MEAIVFYLRVVTCESWCHWKDNNYYSEMHKNTKFMVVYQDLLWSGLQTCKLYNYGVFAINMACSVCQLLLFSIKLLPVLLLTKPCTKMKIRELKQPRRRRQQKPHKFAYLTIKNSIFARFVCVHFSFFLHFEDVLVLSMTWNDLLCSCVDDVRIWWQMFNFAFLCPKRWFQFNSRMVRTHFSSMTTLNNWKMIAETRCYIFRWHSRFRRRLVCLSSLLLPSAIL